MLEETMPVTETLSCLQFQKVSRHLTSKGLVSEACFSGRPKRSNESWIHGTVSLWELSCISLCSFWIGLYRAQLLGEHMEIWMLIDAGARMTHGAHSQRFSFSVVS